jgi:isochorismate hydrolase
MKKTAYLKPHSIGRKSREILRDIEKAVGRHELRYTPDRSALLVLDMQDYFLEPRSHAYIPSAAAILPGLRSIMEAFRGANRPVVATRHLNSLGNAGAMDRWWKELIEKSNPLSNLTELLDFSHCEIIEKSQYNAFHETALEAFLADNKINQVVICGVMTHLCCETTARSAFVKGFDVFFTIDGTATYNEDFHRATLLNLAHGFAIPALVEEIVNRLR